MTSSNGNIFRVTGPLCGEFTVPVNSPHKDQWRGTLLFSLICVWINGWVNNREAGDLRRHRGHYDVSVMSIIYSISAKLRLKVFFRLQIQKSFHISIPLLFSTCSCRTHQGLPLYMLLLYIAVCVNRWAIVNIVCFNGLLYFCKWKLNLKHQTYLETPYVAYVLLRRLLLGRLPLQH